MRRGRNFSALEWRNHLADVKPLSSRCSSCLTKKSLSYESAYLGEIMRNVDKFDTSVTVWIWDLDLRAAG